MEEDTPTFIAKEDLQRVYLDILDQKKENDKQLKLIISRIKTPIDAPTHTCDFDIYMHIPGFKSHLNICKICNGWHQEGFSWYEEGFIPWEPYK